MGFKNHLHVGSLTLQSHTTQDVFAQVPVSFRGTAQTDDFEMDTLPVPNVVMGAITPQDQTSALIAYQAALDAYYGSRAADYQLSQGHPHQQADGAAFLPLNVDLRTVNRLLVQYHDDAGSYRPPVPMTVDEGQNLIAARYLKANNQQAYALTVYIEYEELVSSTAL